ncbi:MAG TPA: nitroreductase family deazaflavin-dependent oxidoreductase [Pseudonocardiaceae bacterium]
MTDRNTPVIEEFRANEGRVVNAMGGMFANFSLLLLTTIGAKSGQQRISPLGFYRENGRIFIFASKGGAPDNPAWYHNLLANPKVTVELGTDRFDATAVPITGAERDDIYAKQATAAPNFAAYQENTTRLIPVIELQRA